MEKDKSSGKRENYITWKDYFMGAACLSAKRSKDPSTQVGACIVNEEKRIVGLGYNGMPNNCPDDIMTWEKGNEKALDNKGLYVCHAEMNAIVNKISADVKGCSMYTTLFPCNECAKIIIQSGIKKVYYLSDKDKDEYKAARTMFAIAGVKYSQYIPTVKKIEIDFSTQESNHRPNTGNKKKRRIEY